jgi:hypothetical protein
MVEQGLAILLVIGSLVYAPFLGAIMNKRAGGTAWTFTAFFLCTVSLMCGLFAFLSGSDTIVWIFISATSWLGGMGAAVAAWSCPRLTGHRAIVIELA